MIDRGPTKRGLWLILLLAFVLRAGYALSLDPMQAYVSDGGDQLWYLANGWGLLSGLPYGEIYGVPFYVEVIPTAPLYLVLTGLFLHGLPDAAAIIGLRLFQSLAGVLTVFTLSRMTFYLTRDQRPALLTALLLAVSPTFVIEPSRLLTESLYLVCVSTGLWLTMRTVFTGQSQQTGRRTLLLMAGIGVVFGLATLTRAVFLLFPVGIAGYLVLVNGWRQWRWSLITGSVLLLVYTAVVGTWTVVNLVAFDRVIIGSNQLMPAIWRGAITEDGSPQQNDALLMADVDLTQDCERDCGYQVPLETYAEQTTDAISRDVGGYIRLRLSELSAAVLQPYATIPTGGESLRVLLLDWLSDPDAAGLQRLITGDNFWLKLVVYLFHYTGLLAGIAGLWRVRYRWRLWLIPAGFILYTLLLHLIVIAEPRYIFPAQTMWWIFAPVTLIALWDALLWRSQRDKM